MIKIKSGVKSTADDLLKGMQKQSKAGELSEDVTVARLTDHDDVEVYLSHSFRQWEHTM